MSQRRTFRQWFFGTPEQLAHEKKQWARIGVAVLAGLAFLAVRYLTHR